MSGVGSGGYQIQSRVAGDQGGGSPSQKPGAGDKKAVLILLVGLAALVGGLVIASL